MVANAFLIRLLAVVVILLDLAVLEWFRHDNPYVESAISDPLAMIPIALASAQLALLSVWLTHGPGVTISRVTIFVIAVLATYRAFAVLAPDCLTFTYGILFVCLLTGFGQRRLMAARPRLVATNLGRQFSLYDLLWLVTAVSVGMACLQGVRLETMHARTIPRVLLAWGGIWLVLRGRLSLWRIAPIFLLALVLAFDYAHRQARWTLLLGLELEAALLLAGLLVFRSAGIRFKFGKPVAEADDGRLSALDSVPPAFSQADRS